MNTKELAIKINELTNNERFINDCADCLMNLCSFDTTPNPNPKIMKKNEDAVFCEIRKYLKDVKGKMEFLPICAEIEKDPAYSLLHFTKTADHPEGLSFREAYRDRRNLVFKIFPDCAKKTDAGQGRNLAINAHIDVVAPFFPPSLKDGIIYGRGACDDKGSIVAMIKSAQLIDRICRENSIKPAKQITFMFVIEEETGGNGSLSLAIDRELKKEYDSIFILECADNRLHPANRGANWYKTEINLPEKHLVRAASSIILSMEEEGRKIKSESSHPLFPHRPVQTCHGIIGAYGEHPSRICGFVELKIVSTLNPKNTLDKIENAIQKYIDIYGDKTKARDAITGKFKVEKHFELKSEGQGIFLLSVYGSTGHMGSILENDGAITKMAYIVNEFSNNEAEFSIRKKMEPLNCLILEGGQGFLPTHPIEEIMSRISDSAQRAFRSYTKAHSVSGTCKTTFDKLHNSAFSGNPNSSTMRNARTAMSLFNFPAANESVRGWDVSCDARLFATHYPEMPVITTGPGKLSDAHSDSEKLKLSDLVDSIKFLTLFILTETGAIQ